MRLYGLIGYPLSHSFSKKYFEEKFEKEGIKDCRFENFPIQSIDQLPALLKEHPSLKGLAVTIPHKQTVIPFLHHTQGIPAGLHACNCIRIKDGQLFGFNTDYIGFERSFSPLLQPHHTKALVLGNGGATAAVIFVLKKLGISYKIISRSIHHDSDYTYSQLTEEIINAHTIIINTTPLGMYPNTETSPDIPYAFITSQHFLYDLVYNPATTLFLKKGVEKGATVKNGADMLALQAEENWRIWNH
jgi:shikimate dehydrogenase